MARHFNRGTDKIDLSSTSLLMPATPNLTFAGWAKFDSFAAENWCYARYNSGALPGVHLIRTLTSGGLNVFYLDSASIGHGPSGPTALSTNTWYHIGGVIDNTTAAGKITATVYLNGVSDGSSFNAVSWGTSTLASRLGSSVSGATMAGSLAHWAFWNTNLNNNQMLALASGAYPWECAPDNLVAFWPLFGDATEPDYSKNKLVGTVTGTTIVNHPRVKAGFRFGRYASHSIATTAPTLNVVAGNRW